MPLVGNDIVDLKHPMNAQKSMDLRFLKKILTDNEIQKVRASSDPDVMLWIFWACKEAAYKVLRKINSNAAFMPRCWDVSCCSDTGKPRGSLPQRGMDDFCGRLCYSGEVILSASEKIPFRVHLTPSYVCCIAADSMAALDHAVWQIDAVPETGKGMDTDPSAFVRTRLARHLENAFHHSVSSIKIYRQKKDTELLPPVACLHDKRLNVDISLSHDGKYAGWAFVDHPCS